MRVTSLGPEVEEARRGVAAVQSGRHCVKPEPASSAVLAALVAGQAEDVPQAFLSAPQGVNLAAWLEQAEKGLPLGVVHAAPDAMGAVAELRSPRILRSDSMRLDGWDEQAQARPPPHLQPAHLQRRALQAGVSGEPVEPGLRLSEFALPERFLGAQVAGIWPQDRVTCSDGISGADEDRGDATTLRVLYHLATRLDLDDPGRDSRPPDLRQRRPGREAAEAEPDGGEKPSDAAPRRCKTVFSISTPTSVTSVMDASFRFL